MQDVPILDGTVQPPLQDHAEQKPLPFALYVKTVTGDEFTFEAGTAVIGMDGIVMGQQAEHVNGAEAVLVPLTGISFMRMIADAAE